MKFKSIASIASVIGVALLSSSANASAVYDNGPIIGTSAWLINSGNSVADSFTVASPASISGVAFGEWVVTGDTPTQVDYAIMTAALGGTTLESGTAALSSTFVFNNSYDVYESVFSIPNLALSVGTYWLQLQNAETAQNGIAAWDINNGPSTAYVNGADVYGSNPFGPPASNSNAFQITTPIPDAFWMVLSVLAGLGLFGKRQSV